MSFHKVPQRSYLHNIASGYERFWYSLQSCKQQGGITLKTPSTVVLSITVCRFVGYYRFCIENIIYKLLRVSRLEFSVQLWFSEMSLVKCWKFSKFR
jgi:hypothetical protein